MVAESGRKELKPAYLILGDDQPKVEFALKRLRARIEQESGTELNIDEFTASPGNAVEAVAAANTLAFLGGVRLVLVKGVDGWRKEDKAAVSAYLGSPAPDACLTLVAEKLPAADPLRRSVEALGQVLEYHAPKRNQYPQWTREAAKKMGLALELAEARFLVERVGEHQQLLLRELEKLSAYKGKARVTRDDLELLVPLTLEGSVFDLVDALAAGRPAAAFTALRELTAAGEPPTLLFYRILWHFQRLTRVVALREEGFDQGAIQSELKLKPFPAKKLYTQAVAFSSGGMAQIMTMLADTDARMKGRSSLPPDLELELCVGGILEAVERGGEGTARKRPSR